MNRFLPFIVMSASLLLFQACQNTGPSSAQQQPNVIIIFTDDQGYQDVGCYGSPLIETPHLDTMASEGIRFTNFYVSSSVCSPSRASLLTGQLSPRNGVGNVFFPDTRGMAPDRVTIAELLQASGYRTACFGKWHLGDLPETLPMAQGFDQYFGIPYSNDMYIGSQHSFADSVVFREGYTLASAMADQDSVARYRSQRQRLKELGIKERVPLFEGNQIVEYPADQSTLTRRYFERALSFIKESHEAEQPFFVYLTPAMPHVPLFASDEFEGSSRRGLYGDVIEEIDHSTGALLEYLRSLEIDEHTIVIFSSDNGPWLGYGDLAGSADPLRDGKFSNYEGGVRVPCIMRWPGTWKPGYTSHQIASTLDLLPTISHYTGMVLDTLSLNGTDLSGHLENPELIGACDTMYYTKKQELWGIRAGDWKYLPYGGARHATQDSVPELFDLAEDPSETTNLIDQYPDRATALQRQLDHANSRFNE